MKKVSLALDQTNQTEVLNRAIEVIENEGLLLYPVDTMYGLGCDPFSKKGVEKIISIKGREKKKMPLLIAADIDMVGRFALLDERAKQLAEKFWPGPLSLCLPRRSGTLPDFYPHMETIVFRVPDHPFAHALTKAADIPLVSTSVNRSGKPAARSIEEAEVQFGQDLNRVDLIIDSGPYEEAVASTIVGFEDGQLTILREGAISADAVRETLSL